MKKLSALAVLLLSTSVAHAAGYISTDLFSYENRSSTFSVDIDAAKLNRFSVEVVYSTPTVNDAAFGNVQVDPVTDTIYLPAHGFATALPVLLATAPATAPSGLSTGTTYYVVKITDNLIKLATTYAQSLTGDTINIVSVSSGAWTFKPLPLNTGAAGVIFSNSNDGANWVVSSSSQALVSILGGSGFRLFDFGEYAYRYLRFTFNGPAAGVIKLRAYIYGKED